MSNIVKTLLVSAVAAVTSAGAAFADSNSEKFVEENANNVLAALNQPELTSAQRTAKFNEYMDTFADVDRIAMKVLGSEYAPQLRTTKDKALVDRYFQSFRDYAMAVYEAQLDQFRGEKVVVTGSKDFDAAATQSYVYTTIRSGDSGEDIEIEWAVQKVDGEEFYKVLDVGLWLGNSQFWLGKEQQKDFLAILNMDRDIMEAYDISRRSKISFENRLAYLVDKVDALTLKLREDAAAGKPSSLNQNEL